MWFFVVMALGPPRLLTAIMFCMVGAFVFRIGVYAFALNPKADVLLPGAMDYLAAGAFLGLAEYQGLHLNLRKALATDKMLLAAFALLALAVALKPYSLARALIYPPAVILMSCALICASVLRPEKHRILDMLAWKPVRHIGQISYGLYVYHGLVPAFFAVYAPQFVLEGRLGRLAMFAIFTLTSFLIAEASWWLIERPALALKEKTPLRENVVPTEA